MASRFSHWLSLAGGTVCAFLLIASFFQPLEAAEEPAITPLDLVKDAAGLFNERGYLAANSYSLDASEVLNDFNGNLIWTKRLKYLPITQNGIHFDVKLTYNGSVGHTLRRFGDPANGCLENQVHINAPEWILSVNDFAVQTLNFENEFVSWASHLDTAIDDDVAALVDGYQVSYSYNNDVGGSTQMHATISLLMGDGSIAQYYSINDAPQVTGGGEAFLVCGEYRSFSKDDRSRGWVDRTNGKFTLFREDGTQAAFTPYRPQYWTPTCGVPSNIADSIVVFLLTSITDQMGHGIQLVYDYSGGCADDGTFIKGRPIFSFAYLNGKDHIYSFDGASLCYDGQAEYTLRMAQASQCGTVARSRLAQLGDYYGNTTEFTYERYSRSGIETGNSPCDMWVPDGTPNSDCGSTKPRRVAAAFRATLYRLQTITYPEGGKTVLGYYNPDGRVEDKMSVDFRYNRPCIGDNPCIKSDLFDSLGRDPYFTNMVTARTRTSDSTGTPVYSFDSLVFTWQRNSATISSNSVFASVRYHAPSRTALNNSSTLIDSFTYRQYPQGAPYIYSVEDRDRGWTLKLLNSERHPLDADAVSRTTNAWDIIPGGTWYTGTFQLSQQTSEVDGVAKTDTFRNVYYGSGSEEVNASRDSVSCLKSQTHISAWGDSTVTYFGTQYLNTPQPGSFYCNTLVDSVVKWHGSTRVAKTATDYYSDGSADGFVGQPKKITRYLIEKGLDVSKVDETFKYQTETEVSRNMELGALTTYIDARGDSVRYDYFNAMATADPDWTQLSFRYGGNPLMYRELRDDGAVYGPYGDNFGNNGPFWYKARNFVGGIAAVTTDTTIFLDSAVARVRVDATYYCPEGRAATDTIEIAQPPIRCRLRLPAISASCDPGSYARIYIDGSLAYQLLPRDTQQDVTVYLPVNVGQQVTAQVAHTSFHGSNYFAEFTHYLSLPSADTVIAVDTVPRSVTQYQFRDTEGRLLKSVDPNGFMSRIYYDDVNRVRRVVLPGDFLASEPWLFDSAETISRYPSVDAESDPTAGALNNVHRIGQYCGYRSVTVGDTVICPMPDSCTTRLRLGAFCFDKLDLNHFQLDSAFLYLYCESTYVSHDTSAVVEAAIPSFSLQMYNVAGDSAGWSGRTPSCWSRFVLSSSYGSHYFVSGINKLDVKNFISDCMYGTTVRMLVLAPSVVGMHNQVVITSADSPDSANWPRLEVFGRRYQTYDKSEFSLKYSYDDKYVDGDNIKVTSETRVRKDCCPLPTGVTSTRQRVTFDRLGRAVRHGQLSSAGTYEATATGYDFADRVSSQRDQLGYQTTSSYDRLGRLTRTTFPDADASHRSATYGHATPDSLDFPIPFDLPVRNLYVTTTYNENGDSVKEYRDIRDLVRLRRAYNTTATGTEILSTYFYYDPLGNLRRVFKPKGDQVEYLYNSLGQLTSEWGSDYDPIMYNYDAGGNLVEVIDGNLVAKSDYSHQYRLYYTYDGLDRRLESGIRLDTNGAEASRTILGRYFYDQSNCSYSMGRLSLYWSSSGDIAYGERYDYDPRGRINRQTNYFNCQLDSAIQKGTYLYFLRGDSLRVSYTYNSSDQVTSVAYADGSVVAYEYDQFGRLSHVGSSTNDTKYAQLSYTARDELSQLQLDSNTVQTVDYLYNARGWLTRINNPVTLGDDRFAEQISYSGDGLLPAGSAYHNGNISGIWSRVSGGVDQHFRYRYDNLDRLVNVSRWHTVPWDVESFQYDQNGNRTRQVSYVPFVDSSVTQYWTKEGTNQLDSLTGAASNVFQYDRNGNTAARAGVAFAYDDFNQLHSAQVHNPNTSYDDVLTFAYNDNGDRIYKSFLHYYLVSCGGDTLPPVDEGLLQANLGSLADSTGTEFLVPDSASLGQLPEGDLLGGAQANGLPGGGGGQCLRSSLTQTYYLMSQGQLLAEYADPMAPPLRTYIYAGGRRIAFRDAQGKLYYYLTDHLGSTRVVIDSLAQVVDRYEYQAYGGSDGQTSATAQPLKYTGKTWDAEAGLNLYYYGARYYDASLGRFTQVDPLRNKYLGWGPYVYSLDNPVGNVDPTGGAAVSALVRGARKVAAKEVIALARRQAVRKAWAQERALLKAGLETTMKLTKKEQAELLKTGKVKGWIGHHINSVSANDLQSAANPNNVEFTKGVAEHLNKHAGNWRNETSGLLIDRLKDLSGPALLAFFIAYDEKVKELTAECKVASKDGSVASFINPVNAYVEIAALAYAWAQARQAQADEEAAQSSEPDDAENETLQDK